MGHGSDTQLQGGQNLKKIISRGVLILADIMELVETYFRKSSDCVTEHIYPRCHISARSLRDRRDPDSPRQSLKQSGVPADAAHCFRVCRFRGPSPRTDTSNILNLCNLQRWKQILQNKTKPNSSNCLLFK